jgi:hypothetical protein
MVNTIMEWEESTMGDAEERRIVLKLLRFVIVPLGIAVFWGFVPWYLRQMEMFESILWIHQIWFGTVTLGIWLIVSSIIVPGEDWT